MAAAHSFLSLEQFDVLYQGHKPNIEYWFGEAVPKTMPTALHGIYQWILAMLLAQRGWKSSCEVRLKLSALAQPVPDVIAESKYIREPYLTEPFGLCIELVSPSDDLRKVFLRRRLTIWIGELVACGLSILSNEKPTRCLVRRPFRLRWESPDVLALVRKLPYRSLCMSCLPKLTRLPVSK